MALKAMKPREAAIFAWLAETYCGHEPPLPAVAETSALAFANDLVSRSGRVNRIGFRVILRIIDLAPLLHYRARFTKLTSSQRRDFALGLDRSRWLIVRILGRLLKTVTMMSYYGDEQVLDATGFDPGAVVARGRELRSGEGRP